MTSKRKAIQQIAIICLIIGAVLLPFCGKSFHMDDPLFIWTGKHLLLNPLDFYGFTVNWYGKLQPMSEVMKNPPLFSYYLALTGGLAGWSERSLHLACLLPALAVAVGTWLVAREFDAEPLLAALAGLLTPVFLLSATTVMCDVMMLAFWVWGIYLWLQGCKRDDPRLLIAAALLVSAAALTKYFGVCLIPLLALYSLSERGRRHTLFYLLIPVVIMAGYQFWTGQLYGNGLLFDAAGYSTKTRKLTPGGAVAALVTGLSYCGGGLLPFLLCIPGVWGRRHLPILAVLPIFALILIVLPEHINEYHPGVAAGRWLQSVQLLLFVTAGLGVLYLAVAETVQRRDDRTLFLAAWILGTFLFAGFLNWTVSGRNILPMAPAVGILLARRLAISDMRGMVRVGMIPGAAVVVSLLVSLAVVSADVSLANAARWAASDITTRYGKKRATVYFQGHWGFQYYMEQYGALAVDFDRANFAELDIMVVPTFGTNILMPTSDGFIQVDSVVSPGPSGLSTMNAKSGASFYASQMAALPFAFGPAQPVRYDLFLFSPVITGTMSR